MAIDSSNRNFAPQPPRVTGRTALALRSLMQIWEEELDDDQESETELMVLLSGMVSPQATALTPD